MNARFVKPLDTALLDKLAENHKYVVTVEENVKNGGYGEHVCAYMAEHHPNVRVCNIAVGDFFVEHGSVDGLRAKIGLSAEDILKNIRGIK